jgi:hypothetical protein
LANSEERLDRKFLEYDADAVAQPSKVLPLPGIYAEYLDGAAIAWQEAFEDFNARRLTGAVGAEKGKDLTALDIETYVVNGFEASVRLAQIVDA